MVFASDWVRYGRGSRWFAGECRELMGRRRQLKAELTCIVADIAAIDRIMRMVDEDYGPEPPNRLPSGWPTAAGDPFRAGEMVVAMLDALRIAGRPVTSAECAEAMLARDGSRVSAARRRWL